LSDCRSFLINNRGKNSLGSLQIGGKTIGQLDSHNDKREARNNVITSTRNSLSSFEPLNIKVDNGFNPPIVNV
jgi:hypothetical protein